MVHLCDFIDDYTNIVSCTSGFSIESYANLKLTFSAKDETPICVDAVNQLFDWFMKCVISRVDVSFQNSYQVAHYVGGIDNCDGYLDFVFKVKEVKTIDECYIDYACKKIFRKKFTVFCVFTRHLTDDETYDIAHKM